MRVLHVNKFIYRRGGAEAYLLDVANLQREAGHEVELWGMAHPESLPGLPLADTFAPHIELEPPPPSGIAKMRAGARMIWSTGSARAFTAALRRFQPDVVHAHNIYHQLSPSILQAARRAGVPVVMTLHDYKLACPNYQMLDHGHLCDACIRSGPWQPVLHKCKDDSLTASSLLALESTIHRALSSYGAIEVLISPSRFLADVMRRAKVDVAPIRVVNHFVELDSGGPRRLGRAAWLAARSAEPRLVFAGRLSPEKGVDTVIRAMAQVSQPTRLHIAGDGPHRAELESLASAIALDRVVFHGRLEKPDLHRLIGTAIASVVPSRWHENQPMSILEAFGLATPVVCTDLGGMPELVRGGVEGSVVPADDVSAWAGALKVLLDDLPRTAHMGLAARIRAERDFSVPTHLARLDEIYVEAREASSRSARASG